MSNNPKMIGTDREALESILEYYGFKVSNVVLEEFSNHLRDRWSVQDFILYRYSGTDYYNIRNFETGKIRLTNAGVLNDVLEGLPQGVTEGQAKQIQDMVYMKCFSTDFKNALMWAHYADNSKGFCVRYDLGWLDHTDIFLQRIFPVIYTDKRLFNIDVSDFIETQRWLNFDIQNNGIADYELLLDILPLFLFKGKAWEYEQEYRIIFTKGELYTSSLTNSINCELDFDCATGIYLGARIEPTIKAHLLEVVNRINAERIKRNRDTISVHQMKISSTMYGFDFESI